MLLRLLSVLIVCASVILHVSCSGTKSLTFVIDDTRSMGNDIKQVQRHVDGIMDAVYKTDEIDDIVLVTFNDPGATVRLKTRDRDDLKKSLNSIRVHNYENYDCPEYSLTGIELALFESLPGSYIYVFTDASAKDYRKVNKIKQLCQKTQSQVIFVLTGDCRRPNSDQYQVYYEIATASSGLVIEVSKDEVNLVAKTIATFIEGKRNPVTSVIIPPYTYTEVPFTVDDKTQSVIISTTGKNVKIRNILPDVDVEKIMWTRNCKMVQLNNPEPRRYTISVKGASSTHVIVYGRTEFTFQHGFSESQPKTIDDTARQPIANEESHLSISVDDPDGSVKIETAQILSMDEKTVIDEQPLKELRKNFYITRPFVTPEHMFKIAVNGHVIKTGKPIRRIAKTPIEPQIVVRPDRRTPTVTITEGPTVTAIYGKTLILTCKVHGYPDPKITWKDDDGNVLLTKTSSLEKPYDFISYLHLNNVTQRNTYSCDAENNLGSDTQSVNVKIGDPFQVVLYPEETTLIKYGETTSIKCIITSDSDMNINWYFKNGLKTRKLQTSDEYTISPDGTELVIKSMNKDLIGKYTCNAALLNEDFIHKMFSTNVVMYGIDVPYISKSTSFLTVKEKSTITIPCTILKGVPKPEVKWQFRNTSSFVDVDTTKALVAGDGLHISQAQLQNSGRYKCIAVNDAGTDEHLITLTVYKKPAVKIVQGTEINVKYGSKVKLECNVTAYPLVKTVWRYENGTELSPLLAEGPNHFEHSQILELTDLKRTLKLYCYSNNTEGEDSQSIKVIVDPAFKVGSHPEETMNVNYGEDTNIPCDIKSDMPMKISWYFVSKKSGEKIIIQPSEKYAVIPDGKVLKIRSADLDLVGTYTCEASLISDINEKISFVTMLEVRGLKKPKINDLPTTIKVIEYSPVTIECGLLEGFPKPNITWQFQKRGTHVFNTIPIVGKELRFSNADLNDFGHYRCIADNGFGGDMKITELIVEKAPVLAFLDGTVKVPYGTNRLVTCNVLAYPPPKIIWTDGDGNVLRPAEIPSESDDNVYKSSVELSKIKESMHLKCHAENVHGSVVGPIDVIVESPFTVEEKPEAFEKVEYSNAHTIKCHITSPLKMKILWYRIPETKGRKLIIKPSDRYSISSDETELTINYMDLNRNGTYQCKAYLIDDVNESVSYNTNIQIARLEKPKIETLPAVLKVIENSTAAIECRIIEGHPKPTITWQFQKRGTIGFTPIPAMDNVLRFSNADLEDFGDYKCIADNPIGQHTKTTALVVLKAPVTRIVDGLMPNVSYGANLLLTCEVVAYPPPKILWTDDDGAVVRPAEILSERNDNVYKSSIEISKVKRSTHLNCYAENVHGSAIENIGITVESPFTVQEKPEAAVIVDYSKPHTIRCYITSPLKMKIQWYRIFETKGGKLLIRPSDKYSISPDETELTINRMDLGLNGKYQCKASLIDDVFESISYNTNIQISGLASPEIDKTTKVMKVRASANETISCSLLKGIPDPVITWFFKSKPDGDLQPINGSGKQLPLSNIGLNDAGYYSCVAENIRGKDQHDTELIVEAPPKIMQKATTYYAVVGDVVLKLPCSATGYPEPTISWKVDGQAITSDSKYRYSIVDGALLVYTPVENDTLEYTCVAMNSLGEDNVTFDGVVTSGIIDYENVHMINLLEGTSKKINCLLPRSDSDSVRWFLNEDPMNNTASYMYFNDANISMDGNYSCRVSTENGYSMETYVVDVGYPPMFKSYQDDPIIDWEGEGLIDCYTKAKPEATVQWFYNGKPLKRNKDDLQLPITKWGQYRCIVSNVHGNVERFFNVTSSGCLINRRELSDEKTPLMLTENLKWLQYETKNELLLIPHQEQLIVSCPNQDETPNSLTILPGRSEVEATCASRDTFWIEGKLYPYSALRCENIITPALNRTGEQCFNENTETILVGYKLHEFVEVYRVCFDTKNNVPLYSRLRMFNSNNLMYPNDPKWFIPLGVNIDKNDVYTCEGSSSSCCIAKEQLVNENDVSFGPSRRSTFIEKINSIPVWQNCDSSRITWQKLENLIREQYSMYADFTVWTGAAKYVNEDGKNIPQYLWKVMRFDEVDSLAIIYVNDPHPTDSQVLCTDLCATGDVSWMKTNDKYTYCCELQEFLSAFNLPEEVVGGL